MMVQIIDFCDPNDQEKPEGFWMPKLWTLHTKGLNIKRINQSKVFLTESLNTFLILEF